MKQKKPVKKFSTVFLALTTSVIFSIVQAQPFTSFDARSMGMGGSSVASSKLANAAYSNPALVSQPIGENKFQLLLPVYGFNIADSKGLNKDIKDFNNAVDAFDAPTAAAVLARSIGKPLTVHAYGGGALGFAINKFSLVFLYNKQYIFDLRTRINTIFTDATLEVRGLEFTEAGVAIPLYSGDNFKFGITPKVVTVNSYDYSELLIDIASGTSVATKNSGKKIHGSDINFDIGSAYDFKNGFVLGTVVRNLNSKEYTTISGNKIKLDALMRVAIAYNGDMFTLAADMDINENKAIAYAQKSKFLTLGAELNLFDWVAVRIGRKQNIASNTDLALNSLGLGFTPFGMGLDVAVMGNVHAVSGAIQLSFTF